MNRDDLVLITGVTGALGSWVAQEALRTGRRVVAIARSSDGKSARQRVERSLAVAGTDEAAGLDVLEGDLLKEGLGLGEALPAGSVGTVIHCAACTEFGESACERSQAANVRGVERVLEVAQRHRARVVHLSTAYVAGMRRGRVYEHELEAGQSFNNVYERTKCLGEASVRRWSAETGLGAIILRPGIVAGAWENGHALRFNTLYDMMHALDALGASARERGLRLVASGSATKNIIPVDYFARAAWRIIRRGVPGTYHLTHPRPLSLDRLKEIFTRLFDLPSMTFVSEETFAGGRPSAAERMCHRVMAQYRSYMVHPEPVFDRSATEAALAGSRLEAPDLDEAWFERLLAYAKSVDWGREAAKAPGAGAERAAEYFDVFLPGKIGRNLLPDLRRLTARFGVALSESGQSHWSMDVREGVLQTVSRNGMATDCRFTMDEPTLLEIVTGRLSPQKAFFNRRAEISGDVALGLRIAAVMAQFFRRFPFESMRG